MDHDSGDENTDQLYKLKIMAEQYLMHGEYPGGPDVVDFINNLTDYNYMYLTLIVDINDNYIIELAEGYKCHLRDFFDCDSIDSKLHHAIRGYTQLIELVELIRIGQIENFFEDMYVTPSSQQELLNNMENLTF